MSFVANHDESSRLELVAGVRAFNHHRVIKPSLRLDIPPYHPVHLLVTTAVKPANALQDFAS